ncbi:MAG: L-histidine N(alpha)-methyltransferase, partial [Bradyrhizobium sp.]|nr:L-histidine N(alpha)-methyltransferase [Bradyrhizobium sp.]
MNVHVNALANAHLPDAKTSAFASDVLAGLTQQPKQLSPKYFYDAAGSDLFEQITRLPEYYPTRTELGILRDRGAEIAA